MEKKITRQQRRAEERKAKKGKVYPRQTYASRKGKKFDFIKEGLKVLQRGNSDIENLPLLLKLPAKLARRETNECY